MLEQGIIKMEAQEKPLLEYKTDKNQKSDQRSPKWRRASVERSIHHKNMPKGKRKGGKQERGEEGAAACDPETGRRGSELGTGEHWPKGNVTPGSSEAENRQGRRHEWLKRSNSG